MDIKTLKKKTLVRSGVYLLITASVVSICIYLNSVATKVQEKHDWLKNDIASLNRKIDGLSAKALEFAEAAKLWETFSEEQKQLQGLRINSAKDLLDKFKDENRLADAKISFSKPEEMKEPFVSETVAVMASDISIDFKGMTDEFILNFIASIMEQFPGYIQVNSLSITRSKDVAKEDLEKISKGEYSGLTEGKIMLSWRDMKYKGPAANKDKDKEEAK